ncbi:hypothetical protein NDU88_003288 [Pleurodeles waltl]|uniref:Uncharacterized protein n=1 Tax=Pleurodeles waltl TaxID=8319 RepID=A0AAV7LIF3_PLEWA|nr:hypothetical protein NDU88_003288 [Pleurodeles waltl]
MARVGGCLATTDPEQHRLALGHQLLSPSDCRKAAPELQKRSGEVRGANTVSQTKGDLGGQRVDPKTRKPTRTYICSN